MAPAVPAHPPTAGATLSVRSSKGTMSDQPPEYEEEAPIDQLLRAVDVAVTVDYVEAKPHITSLVLDVEHAETGHAWRQSVELSPEMLTKTAMLIQHVHDEHHGQ